LPASRKPTVAPIASAGILTGGQRELRLRVYAGSVIVMGPGKADLLSAIDATGSISAAARELGMSYKRCWDLVSIMNEHFKEPLVISIKGGSNGGGAELSALGRDALKRYRAMELRAARAIAKDVERIRLMLRE
jgi:molybdate transport system regulatory protein